MSVGSGSGSAAPGPSTRPKSTGSWQPLPFIHSGFCVHPFHPEASPPGTPATADDTTRGAVNRNRFSWSGVRSSAGDDEGGQEGKLNAYEVPLDVGDEFFAFEEYRCTPEEDGRGDLWYRGYVVQAVSLPSLVPASVNSTPLTHATLYPKPEPSVLIGIFPAAVVHVRPGAPNDNGELTEAYARAVRQAEERSKNANPSWVDEMGTVKEEDEAEGYEVTSPHTQVVDVETIAGKTPETVVRRHSIGKGAGSGIRSNRPKSLILEKKPEEVEEDKEQPPLPKLTAGDSTISGQQWPLVDEIACAIREWYERLPTYLANREYRLFGTVMQHIDALFLGRRQLLSQTLSGDELVRVRRECVSRLVKCNVAQGLEVIVRGLEDGSVMVVDKERAYSGASWVGGITCYVYQVQLAYIDLIPLDNLFGSNLSLIEPRSAKAIARPFSLTSAKTNGAVIPSSGSHYHCLLDVRAFVANPCAPGESAELYFSLYNKVESRFVTEEFCLVLNHLGTPARDAEQRIGRLRTLFTDLKIEDLAHDIFLVCRIVRNGALKLRHENGSTAIRPNVAKRSSLYGIAEGSPGYHNPSVLDTMTDDSFSVTSGYGGHRAPTVDTSYTNDQGNALEGKPTFRRPMGCAVLELPILSKLLSDGVDKNVTGVEFNVPIYLPKDEAQFATLHEHIIHNRVKEFVTSTRAESIALSLKVFQGPTHNIIREHPSLLAEVPLSARLGFPDVVYPGNIRNDLYVKLWSASFVPMPTSSGGSMRVRKSVIAAHHADVQVAIEVRRSDGNIMQDAIIAGGSGEPPVAQYHSLVFHRNDRPTFGELLKVSLPTNAQAEGLHLYLTFRSRGRDRHSGQDPSELEKPFAFAYLPLITDTACINDGDHELILYRSERDPQPAPSTYFEAPALAEAEVSLTPTVAKAIFPLRDRVTLRTYLCSSVQTQDTTLRNLLAWAHNGSDMELLISTLKVFSFVSEEEIAKFVPATFDALFSIMASHIGDRQEEVDDLIFKALMKVLAMTSDRRFPNFKSVFNIYVDTQFNYPTSSFRLLASMREVMSSPTTTDYRAFLKIWHLFFRFIVRSREHDRARGIGLDTTSAHIEADFRKQTKAILEDINALMRSVDRALIGTQTLAVQHYADILADLAHVFQPIEIAEIVIAFADTITFASGSIAIYKLLLLLQVVKSAFESSESRALLVPAIVRWIKPHLGRYEELLVVGKDDSQITKDGKRVRWLECNRLAVTVLAWTVNKLQEWHDSPLIKDDPSLQAQEEDNLEYCLTLLPSLYASYFELSSPKTISALNRQRSSSSSTSSTIWKSTPDVFPVSHPFALISELPPPSLLERHQNPGQDALPYSETYNCGLAETSVVILTLILASPVANISRWLNEVLDIEGIDSLSSTLKSTFEFARSVIRFDAFPKQWLTLNLMCFSSIFRFLEIVSDLMEKETFIPPVEQADSFDIGLWTSFFTLICELCSSDELALEEQGQQRRRAQWIISGDLRDQGAELLMRMWLAIGWTVGSNQSGNMVDLKYGGYQTRFTGLAEQVLSLCLSSHDAMCESAVGILFSMIYAEYVIEGKFDSIGTEIFAKLEKLFVSKSTPSSSDPTMRAYFVAQLRAVFEASPEIDSTFTTKVSTFLDEIELFIDLLLSLRDIPETPQWADERSLAAYQLMNFVSRIGRNDLYVRFVYQLVSIAIEAKNWISAGLALKLHADTHEWKIGGDLLDQLHQGSLKLPPQIPFARKEAIYYHAIDHFIEAEAYEFALELVQDLTVQHQNLTFDVDRLSELLHYQAKIWEQIGSSSRPTAEYYRVAYYGEWDQLNKDKDFVVRGQPWQRYSEFCDVLHLKHPSATLHRSKVPPPKSAREEASLLIWVTPLTPEPDLNEPVFADTVPDNVQSYWRVNSVKTFSSSRPYLRDTSDMGGEAVLTWIEKAILTTKESLPGILNRSEVMNVRYEQVPPVVTAINEVEKATKNLHKLSRGNHGHPPEPKLLGTAINGAVDSPVSGGIQTYRKVFLSGSYIEKHPEFASEVDSLRFKIVEYVKAIQESLVIHKQICKDMAFHEALRNQFYKTFSSEIALLPRLSGSSSTGDETPSLSRSQSIEYSSQNHYQTRNLSQSLTAPPTQPLPPLPKSGSISGSYDSPRLSTYSNHSGSYKLPKLRTLGNGRSSITGPAYSASPNLSIHSTSTPRESTSTQRNVHTPIPGSSTSASNSVSASASASISANSPRRPGSRSGSLRKTPSENRLSWTGSGLGSVGRAMSIVGLGGGGDKSESARAHAQAQAHAQQHRPPRGSSYMYGNGTLNEESERYLTPSENGNSSGNSALTRSGSVSGEPKKEKGLKRFGSLIKRG
ncbi:hypothetical protein I317_01482 [Kwoniella heveanensis CBS 569]|nr:hypothetical protein I317_01482 [Kwoniella heveanensis CBS 569]